MENKPNVGVSLFYACNNNSNFKTLLYMHAAYLQFMYYYRYTKLNARN